MKNISATREEIERMIKQLEMNKDKFWKEGGGYECVMKIKRRWEKAGRLNAQEIITLINFSECLECPDCDCENNFKK